MAMLSFTVALCRLVDTCATSVVGTNPANSSFSTSSTSTLATDLISEWRDVFAEVAFNAIVPLFVRLAKRWKLTSNPLWDCVVEMVALSLTHVPPQHIHCSIEKLSLLLKAKQPSIQLTAYGLIIKYYGVVK